MCFVCSPSQQSPVNIVDDHVYATNFAARALKRLKVPAKKSAKIKPKKENPPVYYVKFDQENGGSIQLNRQTFHLVEFHFHEASEHWIRNKQYPLELHIVFQNGSGRAVLGVMIERLAGKATNRKTRLVKETTVPDGYDSEAELLEPPQLEKLIDVNPFNWLPENKTSYFRYDGSLTTPEFDENVSWLVFHDPISLTDKEIKLLRTHFGLSARNPQPLNRRYMLSTQ